MTTPQTIPELAESLRAAAERGHTITLAGNGTKQLMGGPVEHAQEAITTAALNRVLNYEPHDLTISVEAGLPWRELTRLLAENRQMVPLDPPFTANATVGGVIATNSSGPRRRLYGTARDLVIGMRFVTLEGKVVQSGGMVVKNVAGLDMGKLMIGSFGTLAAIAVANFKLLPVPEVERSFLLPFPSLGEAIAARNKILTSVLQPAAIDLLNPAAGATLGNSAWLLAIRVGGNRAAVDRYERDFAGITEGVAFEDTRQQTLWHHIEDFTAAHLNRYAAGTVVRVSCTLKEIESVMGSVEAPALARAGSGVCYGYFEQPSAAAAWLARAGQQGWKGVIEYSPAEWKKTLELWPLPGVDFEIMRKVKNLFDPSNLLNRGRLYRRL